jgi:hypothetical protein
LEAGVSRYLHRIDKMLAFFAGCRIGKFDWLCRAEVTLMRQKKNDQATSVSSH